MSSINGPNAATAVTEAVALLGFAPAVGGLLHGMTMPITGPVSLTFDKVHEIYYPQKWTAPNGRLRYALKLDGLPDDQAIAGLLAMLHGPGY